MTMYSLRFSTVSIAIVLLTRSAWAQEHTPAPLVEAVTMTSNIPIDDNSLERILGIRKIVGTFTLNNEVLRQNEAVQSVRLRVDLYRQGRLIPVKMTRAGIGGKQLPRHGQFLVQIVDTDHLKLGNAPLGHWRIFLSLMMTGEANGRGVKAGPQQINISKTQFDAQPATSRIGRFTEFPDKNVREIPIFFSASGRVMKYASLPELLRENPQSDVLVGVIEVEK
jgi:hypothetical protein